MSDHRWSINRSASGGFPHSDIPGSKGALASPGLIAECHVLHRLLPPRHPPNALLALDPSQKTDVSRHRLWSIGRPHGRSPRQKEGPTSGAVAVSVLDLERHAVVCDSLPREPAKRRTSCITSIRCQRDPRIDAIRKGPNEWPAKGRSKAWWVWEDSNLRPYAYQAYALTT